jgi:hypothetical protein
LDEAEKKVEILLKGKNGVLKPHSFDTSINSGKTPLDDPEKEGEE